MLKIATIFSKPVVFVKNKYNNPPINHVNNARIAKISLGELTLVGVVVAILYVN